MEKGKAEQKFMEDMFIDLYEKCERIQSDIKGVVSKLKSCIHIARHFNIADDLIEQMKKVKKVSGPGSVVTEVCGHPGVCPMNPKWVAKMLSVVPEDKGDKLEKYRECLKVKPLLEEMAREKRGH